MCILGYIGEKPSNFKVGQHSDVLEAKNILSSGSGSSGSGRGRGAKAKKIKVKKPKVPEKQWEDLCFRCFDGGELLMCNYKTCPKVRIYISHTLLLGISFLPNVSLKVYHLACLDRDKNPRGEWFCPWHHCVTCGKPAVSHCMHCPNAYCKVHNSSLGTHSYLGNICNEHDDIEVRSHSDKL